MPDYLNPKWDDGLTWDDPNLFWDGPPADHPLRQTLSPNQPITLNTQTSMEYWEITLDRAQKTLPVWQTFVPTQNVRTLLPADLQTLIAGFQPLVQARVTAQDEADAAFRAVQSALLKMKLLGTKIPVFIEIQLAEDEGILQDVADLYAVNPRTESTILKRASMLLPVWQKANTKLAAMTPPQEPLTLNIQGQAYTAALLQALLTGQAALNGALAAKNLALNGAREALRVHDQACDRLNKDWYRLVKTGAEEGSALLTALEGIPTEPSTPPPETIEIETLTQGGEEGTQALVAYVAGGGVHATAKELQYTLPGDAEPFTHTVPLEAGGNALGPFAVGTVLTVRTSVGNSAGTRTSAPRTLTIEEPIE